MIITPLRRTKSKPYALLSPGHRQLGVSTVHGESLYRGKASIEKALEKLGGHVCFVSSSVERLKDTTGATSWMMSVWNGRETRMTHEPSGVSVSSLRGVLEGSKDPFADLHRTMEWIGQYGVAPSSISAMAWNLLRSSLYEPVRVDVDPELSKAAFFGPRQQVHRPGTFFDVRSVDVTAAYPSAQADHPYAASLRQVSSDTFLDPDVAGLARAMVMVPDMPYAPLPMRLGPDIIQFQTGPMTGVWPWVELAYAKSLGCDVRVLECWAPRREIHLFYNWWDIAKEGRGLEGYSATLAKAIANSTWGQFAMRGDDRCEVRWSDERGDQPYVIELDDRTLPHRTALNIASETTARVRVQTLSAIYETQSIPLHVDTDGFLVFRDATLPKNSGDGFGQWRVKNEMVEVEIRAPQFYRWRSPEQQSWNYVASGMTESQASRVYLKSHRADTRIAYMGQPDAVLPQGGVFDWTEQAGMLHDLVGMR